MALRGSLDDLSAVDLVQLPFSGRKTGELIVVGFEQEARLYYKDGALVHTVMGGEQGLDVLVEMLGWTEGEFEFRKGIEAETSSIDMDLHRVVMQALKLRDERAMERKRKETDMARTNLATKRTAGRPENIDARTMKVVERFMSASDFAAYACVLDADGTLIAQVTGEPVQEGDVAALQDLLEAIHDSYPRGILQKAYFIDENGTVVLEQTTSGKKAIVLAKPGANLGSVSLGVGKLAGGLD
jgi:predicted regulator of Ras-like GTPase activity (Roadblock/LC7/MglB family)